SYVRVTNLDNGRKVVLRVNDRGPFYSDRIIDLSFAAAKKLGFAESGTARVHVEGIDPYQWWAERGQPVPQAPAQAVSAAVAAALPVQVSTTSAAIPDQGHYLQVGAFANPDAAELLRAQLSETLSVPVFISSVVHNRQVLHRVRLGPIGSTSEVQRLRQSVR